eukprot:c13795_g1_i2.p1 GENE.c13795_g1_i2~~c13795_g1_i2.p1  ORF type:complete len:358 (-),score=0.60 c13795_g1_i2:250-1323(-)
MSEMVDIFYFINEEPDARSIPISGDRYLSDLISAIKARNHKRLGSEDDVNIKVNFDPNLEKPTMTLDEDTRADQIYNFQTQYKKKNQERKRLCYLRLDTREQSTFSSSAAQEEILSSNLSKVVKDEHHQLPLLNIDTLSISTDLSGKSINISTISNTDNDTNKIIRQVAGNTLSWNYDPVSKAKKTFVHKDKKQKSNDAQTKQLMRYLSGELEVVPSKSNQFFALRIKVFGARGRNGVRHHVAVSGIPDYYILRREKVQNFNQHLLHDIIRSALVMIEVESGCKGLDAAEEQLLAYLRTLIINYNVPPFPGGVVIDKDFTSFRLYKIVGQEIHKDGQYDMEYLDSILSLLEDELFGK